MPGNRWAGADTGRLQPLINPIHTKIASNHCAFSPALVFGLLVVCQAWLVIEITYVRQPRFDIMAMAVRPGHITAATADTNVAVNGDNAVLALKTGASGANFDTGSVFTMIAKYRQKFPPRIGIFAHFPLVDLGEKNIRWRAVRRLAGNRA